MVTIGVVCALAELSEYIINKYNWNSVFYKNSTFNSHINPNYFTNHFFKNQDLCRILRPINEISKSQPFTWSLSIFIKPLLGHREAQKWIASFPTGCISGNQTLAKTLSTISDRCGSVGWVSSSKRRVAGSVPGEGTWLCCRFDSHLGVYQYFSLTSMLLSFTFSLPLFFFN